MTKRDKLIAQFFRDPPEVSFGDVVRVLELLGYRPTGGGKGSHHVFRNSKGQMITVPTVHGRKVKRQYVRKIRMLLEEEGYGPEE
ncbi:MAG: type II toxin-antitoxin system HicA family toxin [Armatimonadota bacterium]|nr:type II toxin-antitoxin system HicA family toxin [Armatimonadota bacterium]